MAQAITFTLFDISYRVASSLGITAEGKATGGTTTTLIDTNDLTQADDYWNGGTLWILTDAAGAGAAPEGELSVISDFVNSTGTVTTRDTLTAAPASGDVYAIGKKRYPFYTLVQKINDAFTNIGPIELTDITSLTTATSQTEYTLPVAISPQHLREVWLQTKTGDTDDNKWIPVNRWDIQRTAKGTGDLLILPQLPTSRALKLVYLGEHARLNAASDTIDESVPMELLTLEAVIGCLLWRKQKVGEGDPTLNEQLNFFQTRRDVKMAPPIPKKRAKYLTLGRYIEKDEFSISS